MVKYPIKLVQLQRMYEIRAWVLEGYAAFLVGIYCLIPFLQKIQHITDSSLYFPSSFTNAAQYYFQFVPQYVVTAVATIPIWRVLATLISDMAIFGFFAVILGYLVTMQFPHRYATSSSKSLTRSLMLYIAVIQLICALLCIQPFILSVSVALWLGLMCGHTIAILYQEMLAHPHEKGLTILRGFFYIKEEEKTSPIEGADDRL